MISANVQNTKNKAEVWTLKTLCFGLGGLYVFVFILYFLYYFIFRLRALHFLLKKYIENKAKYKKDYEKMIDKFFPEITRENSVRHKTAQEGTWVGGGPI